MTTQPMYDPLAAKLAEVTAERDAALARLARADLVVREYELIKSPYLVGITRDLRRLVLDPAAGGGGE